MLKAKRSAKSKGDSCPRESYPNNKGVALLMALFMVFLIMTIITEVTYETNVEYAVNSQAISRIKAYYAARSGIEVSLLRINLYKKALAQFGDKMGSSSQALEMIWNMPFTWPISFPGTMSGVFKQDIMKTQKDSIMDASFASQIEEEGSKIDINDIASPSKGLAKKTLLQLHNIFKTRLEKDDDWARDHRELKYDEILNNIADWIDDDTEARNGGDESNNYTNIKDMDPDFDGKLPPNRPLRSVEELHMVKGVTDEIFDLLEPRITVFGQKAINPNHATREVLLSLNPLLTSEMVGKLIARRDDPKKGPFKDDNDFIQAVKDAGGPILDPKEENWVPMIYDSPMNFRITSTGQYGNSPVEITAVVMDMEGTGAQLARQKSNDPSDSATQAQPTATPAPGGAGKSPGGKPHIVYWSEK